MITTNKELIHIQEVMDDNGYAVCWVIPQGAKDWFVSIEWSFDCCQIHRCAFLCGNEARAKRAVKSLLNKTNAYSVLVHSPVRKPVSFYGTFGESAERDWRHFFHF